MAGYQAGTWAYPVLHGPDGRPIVVDLHDGDTVRLLLALGLAVSAFPWLRLGGVSAPELRAAGGPAARDYTAAALAAARDITVTVHGRSFARWLARVDVDGTDLADLLIEAGHGVPYPTED